MMLSVLQRQIYIWKQHVIEKKLCVCSSFCIINSFSLVFFTFLGQNSQYKQCLSSDIIRSVLLPLAWFQVLHPLHAFALNFLKKARRRRIYLKRSALTIHSCEQDYGAVVIAFLWDSTLWRHSAFGQPVDDSALLPSQFSTWKKSFLESTIFLHSLCLSPQTPFSLTFSRGCYWHTSVWLRSHFLHTLISCYLFKGTAKFFFQSNCLNFEGNNYVMNIDCFQPVTLDSSRDLGVLEGQGEAEPFSSMVWKCRQHHRKVQPQENRIFKYRILKFQHSLHTNHSHALPQSLRFTAAGGWFRECKSHLTTPGKTGGITHTTGEASDL